jgi:DNA-binding PadR family transcriptional regulator
MHGYQIIQELSERSGGIWRPSAGSVYPTLQQLQDEGLVRSDERDGRRVFELTDAGRAEADTYARRGREPWKLEGADDASDFRKALMLLMRASMQVSQAGQPETVAEARRILVDARRSMYRLLADDDIEPDDEQANDAPAADGRPL